jgi:hypothetical protein
MEVIHTFAPSDAPVWAHSAVSDLAGTYVVIRAKNAENINSASARSIADAARKKANIFPEYGIEAFGSPYLVDDKNNELNPMVVPAEGTVYLYERKYKLTRGL